MFYIVLQKNSNGSTPHCGSVGWGKLIGKMDVPDSRYLDNHLKGTSQSQKRMRFVIGV
jgi:hypothetical protein